LQKCCGQLVDLVVVHADAKWRDLIGLVHRGPDDVDLRTASTGAWCTEGYRRLGTVVSLPAWTSPEFVDTATPGIIGRTESTWRESGRRRARLGGRRGPRWHNGGTGLVQADRE
jgi:hypothetical protein